MSAASHPPPAAAAPTTLPPPETEPELSSAQRWTLTVVCLATAMLMLDIAVVNTALSSIAADLSAGSSGLQWVIDAYTLPLAAVVVTAGSLADKFGRRQLFVVGLGIFTVASMLCAVAPTIATLDAARALQGIGAAVMFAVSLAVLSVAFPRPQQRMRALSAYGATMAASFAIGPLVGGSLTSAFGWRSIFLINLPIGLLCIAIVHRFVTESTDPRAPRVDRAGLVALTGGLFLLVLGLLRGSVDGWASVLVLASFAGAAGLLTAFVVIEARVTSPMLPLPLFRNPQFTGAQVAAFGLSATLFAMWFYMTLYLQRILGLSAIEAGLVYLPGTLLNLGVAATMASIGQRVAPARLVGFGLGLVGFGLATLTVIGVDTSWWLFLPGLMIALAGTGILNPTISAVALSSLPPEQSGLAAGINDMFRQAGIAVGVAALGALVPVDVAFGAGSPSTYVDGMRRALWLAAFVAITCALVAAGLIAKHVTSRSNTVEVSR
jgi:EmrB/QacA subfamily drug resistance transporter